MLFVICCGAVRPVGLGETGWVGGWSPGIGDPTVLGWVTVVAYLAAAWLCYRAAVTVGGGLGDAGASTRRERILWSLFAGALLLLGLNKQLDLHSALTEALRVVSRDQGWYESRREYQAAFVGILASVAALGVVGLTAFTWRMSRSIKLAGLGLGVLAAFVLVRAASFHHADQLLGSRVLGLKASWILELAGIAVAALGASWPPTSLSQSSRPRRTRRGSSRRSPSTRRPCQSRRGDS